VFYIFFMDANEFRRTREVPFEVALVGLAVLPDPEDPCCDVKAYDTSVTATGNKFERSRPPLGQNWINRNRRSGSTNALGFRSRQHPTRVSN